MQNVQSFRTVFVYFDELMNLDVIRLNKRCSALNAEHQSQKQNQNQSPNTPLKTAGGCIALSVEPVHSAPRCDKEGNWRE